MVLRREVRSEQTDGGQRQRAVRQERENHRELARRPSGLDAAVFRDFRDFRDFREFREFRELSPSTVHHVDASR